jgi:hypothetical protein
MWLTTMRNALDLLNLCPLRIGSSRTVSGVPLSRIDAATNKVVRQWVGKGRDSLRFGYDSIWLTDYKKGLLLRFPIQQVLKSKLCSIRHEMRFVFAQSIRQCPPQ